VQRHASIALVWLAALALPGCAVDRDLGQQDGGTHPAGWADPESDGFHGDSLEASGYPLADCRGCHGQDYGGGAVAVACTTSGCHARDNGPENCGTCHGDKETGPLPEGSNAHTVHQAYCNSCHQVPARFDTPGHADGTVDLVFSGLAVTGGRTPAWDADARGCTDVYCHQGDSPVWDADVTLDCAGCHDTPAIHARWIRVVDETTCAGCHQGSPATGHLDGQLTLAVSGCTACHGDDGPAPPAALDGSTAPSSPGVGAHQRHLDATLPGRIGRTAECTACHTVPTELFAAGHLDDSAPADVNVDIGNYDPATQSCTAWCHVDGTPVWTDDSGAARACDACHGFPPEKTLSGGPHPVVAGDLAACLSCHTFTPTTHVDGEATFQ
jgi:predicted CxxxxCH...CXXCH cytochrome family protein